MWVWMGDRVRLGLGLLGLRDVSLSLGVCGGDLRGDVGWKGTGRDVNNTTGDGGANLGLKRCTNIQECAHDRRRKVEQM